jgi:citrate lyase beta subunit
MSARRCLLFVPGSRPERFTKALDAAADMICIDLEDAVAANEKDAARASVVQFLNGLNRDEIISEITVRINHSQSSEGLADLHALKAATQLPDLLMLPKVSDPAEISIVEEILGDRCPPLVALLETALGVERAFEIASSPKLAMLMFGGADYMAELGGRMTWESMLYARSRIAAAAASAHLQAIDVPFLDIRDEAALIDETDRVAAIGFACKSAIHPGQVEAIQTALTPSREAVERAQKVLQAFADSPHAAIQVDGKLVDKPILLSARRILIAAEAPMPENFPTNMGI